MRRRLFLAMGGLVLAVLLVVGGPLVLVVRQLARAEAAAVLRRQAEAIATDVANQALQGPVISARQLAAHVPPGDRLIFRTADGRTVTAGTVDDDDVIAVEVDAVAGTRLRLETSAAPVDERMNDALVTLGLVGVATLGLAMAVAALLGERLTRPLASLADSADRLGRGDFSATAPRSGLEEVDTIATALDTSAARIAALVRAEREFSANASHQLRSALTGLRLRLEALVDHADPAVSAEARPALEQAERLSTTVDDLLRLARTGRYADAAPFDLTDLVRRRTAAVILPPDEPDRRIHVNVGDREVVVHAAEGAMGQAVDVLLDNAVRHGAGDIHVSVVPGNGFASVVVEDEGPGLTNPEAAFAERPAGATHGIGLRLARTLVEADGGRLDVVSERPAGFRITLATGGPQGPDG